MELTLTVHERESPLGRKLTDYLTERLETLRKHNDNEMSGDARAKLIAQIAETKKLLRAFTQDPIELKAVAP